MASDILGPCLCAQNPRHVLHVMLHSCTRELFYIVCVHNTPHPRKMLELVLPVARRFMRHSCVEVLPFLRLRDGLCRVPIRCTRAPAYKDFILLNLRRLLQAAWRPYIVHTVDGYWETLWCYSWHTAVLNTTIVIHVRSSRLVSPSEFVVTVCFTCFNVKHVPHCAHRLISEFHLIPTINRDHLPKCC